MQVSNTSSSSTATSGGDARQITQLQKQLKELTEDLKDVATSTMNAKAKEQKVELLQVQIMAVQQQINTIQNQKQQDQLGKADAVQQATNKKAKRPVTDIVGVQVDKYI